MIIFSQDWPEHLTHLHRVSPCIREAGLKLHQEERTEVTTRKLLPKNDIAYLRWQTVMAVVQQQKVYVKYLLCVVYKVYFV